jgi:hypothetical protein
LHVCPGVLLDDEARRVKAQAKCDDGAMWKQGRRSLVESQLKILDDEIADCTKNIDRDAQSSDTVPDMN